MAHRSRKKHIKHLHQHADHDASQPQKAKNGGTKPASAQSGKEASAKSTKARLTSRAKEAAKAAKAAAAKARPARGEQPARGESKRGVVRSLATSAAKVAAKKVTARPKRIISRAKARVRSLLGRDRATA